MNKLIEIINKNLDNIIGHQLTIFSYHHSLRQYPKVIAINSTRTQFYRKLLSPVLSYRSEFIEDNDYTDVTIDEVMILSIDILSDNIIDINCTNDIQIHILLNGIKVTATRLYIGD
jgi:hypothetical protein